MRQQKILILADQGLSSMGESIESYFDSDVEIKLENIPSRLENMDYKVLVYDHLNNSPLDKGRIERLLKMKETFDYPVIVLGQPSTIQDKLDVLEVGCEDFIEATTAPDEACARITRSIMHKIAAVQLSSRLELANQTAHSALIDNSDLGANIQFLISVHDCDNLDQLGQLFFSTISRYGLNCSLQMRSDHEIKSMEANGMAKDLESQLLYQLRCKDRYIDFGARTIVNYDRVSLLIRNMPQEDPLKYGMIKDNTFALIQGVNARVIALENNLRMLDERETLKKLTSDVRNVMSGIQSSYQKVMRNIANEVDSASEKLAVKLPSLALTETDERYIESTMDQCVLNTNQIFNDGLRIDEIISRLEKVIERSLRAVDIPHESIEQCSIDNKAVNAPVELF